MSPPCHAMSSQYVYHCTIVIERYYIIAISSGEYGLGPPGSKFDQKTLKCEEKKPVQIRIQYNTLDNFRMVIRP